MSSIIDSVSIEIGSLLYGRFEDFANSFSHVLAEFIDNALQSARDNIEQLKRLDERYKLRVDIEIEWDITEKGTARKIIVKDNAGGIAENRYVYAFQPARTPELSASWMPLSTLGMYSFGTTPPTILFSNL